jgi:signal transduction histidine kinase
MYSRRMTPIVSGDDAPKRTSVYLPLVAELVMAWPRRLRAVSAAELVVAAVVLTLSLVDVWAPLSFVTPERHRPLLTIVFVLASAALLWRRQAPLAVLAFVFGILSLLYLAIGAPEALGTFLPPLFAVYALGRYAEPRSLVLGVPIIVLGTAMHEFEDPQFVLSGPAIFFWALLAAAWPVGRAFRVREQAVERLSLHAQQLEQQREADSAAAAAAERARIARELHDVVGHGLSVLVLQLVAAQGLLESGDEMAARERLGVTEGSARETLAEMRRLLGLLDEGSAATLAPQPGLSQIERLVEDTRAAGVDAELVVEGDPVKLPAGLELAAYRIVQEALTNVIKHARPASTRVRIAYRPDELGVEVEDDGHESAGAFLPGRGVAGMRERVVIYNGHLTVGPRAGAGFAVEARFPVLES